MSHAIIRYLLLLSAAISFAASAESAAKGSLAYDWGDPWRFHLTLRRPTLTDGTSLLPYHPGWDHGEKVGQVYSDDAPGDWMKSDFDDSGWAYENGPGYGTSVFDPVVRVERLRGQFEVADPARVTGLSIDIEYIGGVAVWLNGQEIARQNLPAGALTGEVQAEAYPQSAYEWFNPMAKDGHPTAPWEWDPPANPKNSRLRFLNAKIDPKKLVKGANVLAVSLHHAQYQPIATRWIHSPQNGGKIKITGPAAEDALKAGRGESGGDAAGGVTVWPTGWTHCWIKNLHLTATPSDVIKRPARPSSAQEWALDIHQRVRNHDFGDSTDEALVVRMVGAKNGTYSAQVVVGSASALSGVGAKMSELSGPGKIPAEAIRVRYAAGIADNPAQPDSLIMDRLADKSPGSVPANSCQPIWITVKVPKNAAPGEYKGTLTLSPASLKPVDVRLYVMNWTLPEPNEYASFVGIEHAIWSAPAQYNIQPWSDKHWEHIERVVKMLAEVGNDMPVLPLTCGGNEDLDESLVAWVKKGNGYEYDWKNFDRYLDLVAKYWGTNCWVVAEICSAPYGNENKTPGVRFGKVADPGDKYKWIRPTVVTVRGESKPLTLPEPGSEEWKKLFVPFAKEVSKRLKDRKFQKLSWGWIHDNWPKQVNDMITALTAEIPDAGWARSSHHGGKVGATCLDMHIRDWNECSVNKTNEPISRMGWKGTDVCFPRMSCTIQSLGVMDTPVVGTFPSPMSLHWLTENCLVHGALGFARLGADFWPSRPLRYNYFGCDILEPFLFSPGPDGADSTQRFEALREGVQEAEVRIWLEKNGKDQAEPAKTVLNNRIRTINAMPQGFPGTMCAYYGAWQERSWDLYSAAAKAQGSAPGEAEKKKFFGQGK